MFSYNTVHTYVHTYVLHVHVAGIINVKFKSTAHWQIKNAFHSIHLCFTGFVLCDTDSCCLYWYLTIKHFSQDQSWQCSISGVKQQTEIQQTRTQESQLFVFESNVSFKQFVDSQIKYNSPRILKTKINQSFYLFRTQQHCPKLL